MTPQKPKNLMDLLKITQEPVAVSSDFQWIATSSLKPSIFQPRHEFNKEDLDELIQSIKQQGILTPLLVRQKESNHYEIIAGERRYRSALAINLITIPCRVLHIDDKDAAAIALMDNIQRKNLNFIDEALGYQNLMNTQNYTQEQLATTLGKSRSHIAHMTRLLKLDKNTQNSLCSGELTLGHCKILAGQDHDWEWAQKIIKNNLNVRETEKMINKKETDNEKYQTKKTHHNKNQDIIKFGLNSDNDEDLASLRETLSKKITDTHILLVSDGAKMKMILDWDDWASWEKYYNMIINK